MLLQTASFDCGLMIFGTCCQPVRQKWGAKQNDFSDRFHVVYLSDRHEMFRAIRPYEVGFIWEECV